MRSVSAFALAAIAQAAVPADLVTSLPGFTGSLPSNLCEFLKRDMMKERAKGLFARRTADESANSSKMREREECSNPWR